MKVLLKNGSKSLIDKVLSPTKEKERENKENAVKEKPILMTRRELMDPFASDEEDDEKLNENERIEKKEEDVLTPPNLNPETASVSIVFHQLSIVFVLKIPTNQKKLLISDWLIQIVKSKLWNSISVSHFWLAEIFKT